MVKYYKFESNGTPTSSEQCTTQQSNKIKCDIPIGGEVGTKFYNLMVMDGEEADLNGQANENIGKITELTEEEANQLGQLIIPPGTEMVVQERDPKTIKSEDLVDPSEAEFIEERSTKTLIAGTFNVREKLQFTEKTDIL